MGQGRENARTFLKENTDIRKKLESGLRKKMEIPGLGSTGAAAANGTGNGSSNGIVPEKAGEKPPVKPAAAAATAGAGDGKARPSAR
jgi:hypothetical protein